MVISPGAVTTGPSTGLEDSSRGVRACSFEPQSWFQERQPHCGTAHFLSAYPTLEMIASDYRPNTAFQRTRVRSGRGPGPLNLER